MKGHVSTFHMWHLCDASMTWCHITQVLVTPQLKGTEDISESGEEFDFSEEGNEDMGVIGWWLGSLCHFNLVIWTINYDFKASNIF